uniref:Reverse transcriptase domain-containing protein n=1 Tax=Tanacetum cinerariifolium TaxID=118510 RepID=A0A699I335_TANCI|nr:reverse transcriptase domain-containing protein [Tanacetum cinerariifolium]
MIAIFQDMLETSMEFFMDDFSEKCHFTVTKGIALGHKVSRKGLEVDKSKIGMIAKLPPPTNVKAVRSFLGHARSYRRFIKDFSKISRPMTKLLEKDSVFNFDEECNKAFETLKEKLTNAPIMVSPNWSLPFKLMCDASDFALGAVLGQREEKQNVAADYLSRLKKPNLKEIKDEEINDEFPDEFLMTIKDEEESPCVSRRDEMPLKSIQVSEIFDIRGIDIMGPFRNPISSNTFLSQLTTCPNGQKPKLYPLTTHEVKNTNRALKRILEKTVKHNPSVWSRKLDDALWAFHTAYKTPISTISYQLLYGKTCHLPFKIEHRAYWALRSCNPDLKVAGEKRFLQFHELDELRLQAYENSKLYKA